LGPEGDSDPNQGDKEEPMQMSRSLVGHESRAGMLVRVVEDKRRPEYEGKLGTIKGTFGDSDYPALDVQLENGRLELFWFHQLEAVSADQPTLSAQFYDGG
jgi:hypothetical protein